MPKRSLTVWRLIAHPTASLKQSLRWYDGSSHMAIGWGELGDLRGKQFASAELIADEIRARTQHGRTAMQGGACLFAFCRSVEIGDLVILSQRGNRVRVMQVTGKYEHLRKDGPVAGDGFFHRRKFKMLPIDPDMLWTLAGGRVAEGFSHRWPFIRCARTIMEMEKKHLIAASSPSPSGRG